MVSDAESLPGPNEPDAPLPRGVVPASAHADEDLFDFATLESLAEGDLGSLHPERVATIVDLEHDEGVRPLLELDTDDLDHDLFHFDELFTALESEAGDDAIPDPAPAPASQATAPSARGAVVPRRPTPAPPPPLPRMHARRAGTTPPDAPSLLASLPAPELEPPEGMLRKRLVEVLVVAFLLANAALIFFAWQASRSFQSTLATVRDDLSTTLSEHRGGSQAWAAAPTLPGGEREAAPQPPTRLEGFVELELEQARDALDRGAFGDARGRLFDLLANADRFPVADDDLATLEFLVADSYFREGAATAEEAR